MRSISSFILLIAQRKKIGVFSSRRPRKHLHVRSRLFVPHSQPASQLIQNGAQCLKSYGITIDPLGTSPLNPREWFPQKKDTISMGAATFSLKNWRLDVNIYTVRFHANRIEIKVFDFKVIDSVVIKYFNCVYNFHIYNLSETKLNEILVEQTNFET